MAFIELVPAERAGDAADLFEADTTLRGYLPNYTRAFAHRPDVYRAWRGLIGAIAGNMDTRRYELATFAAARRLRSSYCALAHGKVLADAFLSEAEVEALARARPVESLDDVDRAVLDLADAVAHDATAVTARGRRPSPRGSASRTRRSSTSSSRPRSAASTRRRSTRSGSSPTRPTTTCPRRCARR